MKLFSRRFKGYLTILLIFFLFSYALLNYVNISNGGLSNNNNNNNNNGKNNKKPSDTNKQVDDLDFVKKVLRNTNESVKLDQQQQQQQQEPQEVKRDNDDNSNNEVKRFYAIDGNGRGSINREVLKCSPRIEVEVVNSDYSRADFTYFLDMVPHRSNMDAIVDPKKKRHYYMVYAMESEPHSGGGSTWTNADFYMWYNLDLSFPEPATYFDVHSHLPDLLAPPRVEFEQKSSGDLAQLVWVLSNCNAFNRRESFVKRLMELISVDSYGFCLRNKDTHTSQRMQGNAELFTKYKFVIAIENSNCDGYVTEKLVHAVASGSIPIVAGRDNKPNYMNFMPNNSFINIYDYKTPEDLVAHLKKVASSKDEYEKYIWFKRKHNYTREQLQKMSLPEQIELAKSILGYERERTFFDGLILKEKSENKLCKIARYLASTPQNVVEEEIKKKRRNRPDTSEACLPHGNLAKDFGL